MEKLCRICLSNGAEHHIFGKKMEASGIFLKIQKCLNEKLEDIEGYPHKICSECNSMLDCVSEFIDKFKQSCSILYENQNLGIGNIKEEPDSNSDYGIMEETDIKIDFTNNDEVTSIIQTNNHNKCNKPQNNECSKKSFKKMVNCKRAKSSFARKKPPKLKKEKDKLSNGEPKKGVPKLLLCDSCGAVFINSDRFREHIKRVHKNLKFKCDLCDKFYSTKSGKSRHIKDVHKKLKSYPCTKCDEGFTSKIRLQRHILKVHENRMLLKEKKFSCKRCDKKFCESKSLIIHERSIHTGERPEICSVCNSAFFHKDYLKEHMRLHTGEAPFKCVVCGKGHAQRGNMKSHLRVHRLSELDPDILKKLRPTMLKYFKKE